VAGGGATPEAGYSGPTVTGIVSTLNATSRTVDELVTEIIVALADDTASVPAKPADRAKAPMVLTAYVLSFMTRSLW
jgi:hypothetical protein